MQVIFSSRVLAGDLHQCFSAALISRLVHYANHSSARCYGHVDAPRASFCSRTLSLIVVKKTTRRVHLDGLPRPARVTFLSREEKRNQTPPLKRCAESNFHLPRHRQATPLPDGWPARRVATCRRNSKNLGQCIVHR